MNIDPYSGDADAKQAEWDRVFIPMEEAVAYHLRRAKVVAGSLLIQVAALHAVKAGAATGYDWDPDELEAILKIDIPATAMDVATRYAEEKDQSGPDAMAAAAILARAKIVALKG